MTDSADPKTDKIVVGKISAAYGLKGWVKVYSYTEPMEKILDYAPWYLKKGAKQQKLELKQGKKHGKGLVVLGTGFDDRNHADAIVGSEVWVEVDQLPDLEEGEFFWHQLEGLKVFNEADELLGEVSQLLETGANDVLVVKACEQSIDSRERLIPYVEPAVVKRVDLQHGKILVAWGADF